MRKQYKLFQTKSYAARKVRRPISLKEYNHLILKARLPILRRQHALVHSILMETQRRFGVRIRAFSLMPTHIHLVVKVESRTQWANALRFFAGQLALKLGRGKLWVERAWSRIVRSGRDYAGVLQYICENSTRAGIFNLRIDGIVVVNGLLWGEPEPPPQDESNMQFAFAL